MGSRTRSKKAPAQPAVDYGATADTYFAGDNSEEEEEEMRPEAEEKSEEEESSSSSDNEEEEEEEEEDAVAHNPQNISVPEGEEPCSFDLRNLTAVNSHPLHEGTLYVKKKKTTETLTIDAGGQPFNEDYLLTKATEGCAQLISALWHLPTERSDAGPMVTLPSYDVIPIPRALPPPAPKAETKWEKFAKERGLPLNKEKRSRKVWDEDTNTWKVRHGYDAANSDTARYNPIMEVGANDNPYDDPWERQRDEKFERTEANRQNKMKNQERAGVIPKGTTRRVLKSREQQREAGKIGGRNDNQLPTGVPVDMNGKILRGKSSTLAALKATQVSTASLGKFDKLREGEPERKMVQSKKKRKTMGEGNSGRGAGGGEQERASKVLQSVLHGGGVEKEKARKKGKLAKGVTAYDYEYDDGHDKAMYSKKKGRGGMGKNKKMTKKRIK